MTDEEIMLSVKQGNFVSFKILVERHLKKSVSVAERITGNYFIAEEIVQEVFLKIWQKACLWEEKKSKFKTWFYYILKNACIDFIRKNKTKILNEIDGLDVEDENENIGEKIENKQLAKIVKREINALKEKQKMVLIFFLL